MEARIVSDSVVESVTNQIWPNPNSDFITPKRHSTRELDFPSYDPYTNTADMDDSDEYEFDDFVLDEQTLAVLDRAEQKYQGLTTPVEPAKKRHKSDARPSPAVNLNHVATVDFDDLPEISVRGDGSYGFRSIATKPIPVVEPKQQVAHSVSLGKTSSSSSSNQSRQNRQPIVLQGHSNTSLKKSSHKIIPENINPTVQGSKSLDSHHLEAQLQQLQKKLDEVRMNSSFAMVTDVLILVARRKCQDTICIERSS